jgi:hypothetical protein
MAGAFGGLLAGVITQYMDGVGNTPGWQWVSRRHLDIWPELWRGAGLYGKGKFCTLIRLHTFIVVRDRGLGHGSHRRWRRLRPSR